MSHYNVAAFIDIVYKAEKATERFYLGLVEMFLHEPEAASVWWDMASEEGLHMWLVEKAREALSSEQLEAPVDSKLIERALRLAEFSPESAWARIQTLEDAYREAQLLEAIEAVNLLAPIMYGYFPNDIRNRLVRSQLDHHLKPLERLGSKEWRQTVKARKPSAG